MRIKRIEIHGFKSFADKTEIDLGAGLTAVVGPNGSGKSNLAEAVKWVLGEQSARILRGQRMDDIIFSGTARRRGVGYAEVSLVFDNAEKRMPLDYSEVVITRRVYRNGDGEYLINRKACRLRDITELFLDTGVGKDSYSFVGQGRIEEILNADPRQRRGIFEEAAGISRYKLRKKETETRLDEVHANLRRVSDIEAELNMQLAPLQDEASRATRYLELQSARDDWARELLLYEIGLADRQVASIKTQIERASDEKRSRESQLSILEAERSEFAMRHSALLAEVSRAEADLRMVEHDRQQLNERLAELQAEMPAADESVHRMREAVHEAQAKSLDIERQQEIKQKELADAETAVSECQALLSSLDADANADEAQVSVADLSAKRADALERVASLKAEIESGERTLLRIRESIDRATGESDGLASGIALADKAKDELLRCQADARDQLAQLKARRERLTEEAGQVQRSRVTEEGRIRELEADLFLLQRKQDSLRRAEEQYEGLSRAARHILELKLPGVRGVLARLIDVKAPFARAIEMSLGAALSDMVVSDEKTARRAIAELKEKKAGRATFYPLDIFRSRSPRSVPEGLRGVSGYLGRASELVDCEDFARPVIDHLLQNVLVVDNLETAGVVAGRTGYGFRIMTVDGDMMLPGGSMSGGSLPMRTGNVLVRQQEIEDTERELAAHERGLAESRTRVLTLAEELERLGRALSSLEPEIRSAQAELDALVEKMAAVALERELLGRSQAAIKQQIAEQCAESARVRVELDKDRTEHAATLDLRSDLDARLAAEREIQEERLRIREERLSRQRELELSQARTVAKRELLTHVCAELKRDMQEMKSQVHDLESRLKEAEQRSVTLSGQRDAFAKRLALLDEQKRDLKEKYGQAQGSRESLQELERANLLAVASCRESIENGRSRLHALEIRLVRVEGEFEGLTSRLTHDYPGEELRSSTLSNRSEAESEIARFDQQIGELGDVRVSSINECRRLQERLAFLATERDDLAVASGKLLEAISELDKVMAARFVDNFAVVQREFAQVAERLFAGGAARVSMVDPSMPLETGIEIDVQPPGKRLQNIRLLSGGERALAAVSLLCAVLRVKPTPFCVLDEVDAALDDANVERLIPVLRELSTHTQFLLVTHTKSTMLAADILYGVTMPEQGVSRVLSVRVSEVSAQNEGEAQQ